MQKRTLRQGNQIKVLAAAEDRLFFPFLVLLICIVLVSAPPVSQNVRANRGTGNESPVMKQCQQENFHFMNLLCNTEQCRHAHTFFKR